MGWLSRIFAKPAEPAAVPDAPLHSADILDRAEAALRGVIDPEIGINIVDLGLVYALRTGAGVLEAEIGLTSPSCPLGEYIADQAREKMAPLAGGREFVQVTLIRDKTWSPELMSPAARRQLGRA